MIFSELKCWQYLLVRRTGEKVLEKQLIFGDPAIGFLFRCRSYMTIPKKVSLFSCDHCNWLYGKDEIYDQQIDLHSFKGNTIDGWPRSNLVKEHGSPVWFGVPAWVQRPSYSFIFILTSYIWFVHLSCKLYNVYFVLDEAGYFYFFSTERWIFRVICIFIEREIYISGVIYVHLGRVFQGTRCHLVNEACYFHY